MKKPYLFLVIVIVIVIVIVGGTFLLQRSAPIPEDKEDAPLKVAATIFPLFDIAQTIAGDKAETVLLLPPGASPHTFELTPGKARELQKAELVFSIGGVDDWVDPLIEGIASAKKVTVTRGIQLRHFGEEDDHENEDANHEHGEASFDPHYWLDSSNAMIIAVTVAEELTLRDPENEQYYQDNLATFLLELEQLNDELTEQLASVQGKPLLLFHDAWQYFADAYSLEIIETFVPSAGQEPAPQHLANLTKLVRNNNITAVFSEPQLSTATLEPFLQDLNLEVYVLDPLGGVEGRESYSEMMRYNARTIAEALK